MKKIYNKIQIAALFALTTLTTQAQQLTLDNDTRKAPAIMLSRDTVHLSFKSEFTAVQVLTNTNYSINNVPQWLTVNKESNGNVMLYSKYHADYKNPRTATIQFNAEASPYTRPLVVTQGANTEIEYEKIYYWTEDGMTRVLRSQDPNEELTKEISLFAARNEIEHGQIVLRSDVHDFTITGVSFTDLKSDNATIPSTQLKYNFALYEFNVPTENKGHTGFAVNGSPLYPQNELPDPLSNDKTIAVPIDKNQPIYITVNIPKNTLPQVYNGTVIVNTTVGNLEVPLSVQVFPVTVPDLAEAKFVNYNWMSDIAQGYYTDWNVFDTYYKVKDVKDDKSDFTDDFYQIINSWGESMKEHRQNAVLIHTVALLKIGRAHV